ncbi:AraC family transcriptional regulator [Flavitalea sp. BT771]|uniref:helix-turn-helix transcriptional regulator n=1 Tax=Flavitalea sp. BT771 TaxID=3063329 RepID=UPI0026E341DA|nr:AraC family transcriptional regulator [Flavitalea sp. BT771]MDO6430717.1 AraC family transcriptional regulator [Flavitalea sp. BT771]MDV6219143.1 AraC family transcriptional regulator [Flavitalea sp. BT771]
MITKRRDIATLLEVRQFIQENFSKDIPISAICREFGLNRTKLQEGFHQMYSTSVHALISNMRMEKARSMLRETEEPVKVIGMECGYKTLSSFTRVFTRLHKVSPTRYRVLSIRNEKLSEKVS